MSGYYSHEALPHHGYYQQPQPRLQQQGYGYPSPQERQWDPEKIWAEANGSASLQRSGDDQYGQPPPYDERSFGAPEQQGHSKERGLGATVLGGAGGAFLGHEMGHGKMATLGGLAVGAIAANAFEHHHEKKKRERQREHAYERGYERGETRSIDDRGDRSYRSYDDRDDRSDFSRADGRSIDDREYDYEPPRHHHHHRHRDSDYSRRDDYDDYSRRDDYSDTYSQRDRNYGDQRGDYREDEYDSRRD